jgi:hypothetical protein
MSSGKSVPHKPKSHLLIAGTGRAGTSFLVQYLAELGLDTHLSRSNKSGAIDPTANAGLEDIPIATDLEDLPYVVKTPWMYQIIDQLLANKHFKIDGVIIPIRNLTEAAMSRSIVELQNIHHNQPWMAKLDKTWREWGYVPGGAIYSTSPVDQARILAVGLHQLVEKLAENDVPFVLVSFPKLIEDSSYLYEKLRSFLPPGIKKADAIAAHKKVADVKQVRTTREFKSEVSGQLSVPTESEAENIALKREIQIIRNELEGCKAKLNKADVRLERIQVENSRLLDDSNEQLKQIKTLKQQLDNTHSSTSWRLTKPVRITGDHLHRLRKKG